MPGLNEFGLIARYFTHPGRERRGVGDDCALIDTGSGTLAITSDMLLEDVHFFSGADPQALGHKALAVNLSDLAAAGAKPRCFLLDLALPEVDESWLARFSSGLMSLARSCDCELIGGDTTRSPAWPPAAQASLRAPAQQAALGWRRHHGPIVIAITAIGAVPSDAVRGRDGAQPGDDIWVSGCLGDAALAVLWRRHDRGEGPAPGPDNRGLRASDWQAACTRMDRPQPRVALGQALRGLASAAIDVSDGLVGDLGHILSRSGCGADIDWRAVPCSGLVASLPLRLRQACTLAGGDAYELLFTAPPAHRSAVAALSQSSLPLTRIGTVRAGPGLHWVDAHGPAAELPLAGLRAFDHFDQDADHDVQQ